jgi:hypothetical protein
MKTLIPAAIRCSLMFTGVAALSLAHPASVQAVPTTYEYTGNPFTDVDAPYTTSDFVTAMVTLADKLPPNMPLTQVNPTAFTLFDGVFGVDGPRNSDGFFLLATDASGAISQWYVSAESGDISGPSIGTINTPTLVRDRGGLTSEFGCVFCASNEMSPGVWSRGTPAPESGSTLSLMTLTLMALGVAARRFKRGAA